MAAIRSAGGSASFAAPPLERDGTIADVRAARSLGTSRERSGRRAFEARAIRKMIHHFYILRLPARHEEGNLEGLFCGSGRLAGWVASGVSSAVDP
jgi:hypothetical protein